MEYKQMNGFDEYKSVLNNKVSQLRRPKTGMSLVVFFDGKNATKHHNHNMLSKESFTKWLIRSMKTILRGYEGTYEIYAITDEITVIFHDSASIAAFLHEDCIDSIYGLLISQFTLIFNRHISCAFKGAAYFTDNIAGEINYRKAIGQHTALEYYAKEYMKPECYHQKSEQQIIDALKVHQLYDSYMKNTAFRNGLYFSNTQNKI